MSIKEDLDKLCYILDGAYQREVQYRHPMHTEKFCAKVGEPAWEKSIIRCVKI